MSKQVGLLLRGVPSPRPAQCSLWPPAECLLDTLMYVLGCGYQLLGHLPVTDTKSDGLPCKDGLLGNLGTDQHCLLGPRLPSAWTQTGF